MTRPTPIFFKQFFILTNLYQHAKNQTFSLICSRDIVNSKILQSYWQITFGQYFRQQNFPKYEICQGMQELIPSQKANQYLSGINQCLTDTSRF